MLGREDTALGGYRSVSGPVSPEYISTIPQGFPGSGAGVAACDPGPAVENPGPVKEKRNNDSSPTLLQIDHLQSFAHRGIKYLRQNFSCSHSGKKEKKNQEEETEDNRLCAKGARMGGGGLRSRDSQLGALLVSRIHPGLLGSAPCSVWSALYDLRQKQKG